MTKIIWIDIDEVLAELLDFVLEYHDYLLDWKIVSRDDIIDYYVHNMEDNNLTKQEWVDWFRKWLFSDKDLWVKPIIWAMSKLEYFKNKWYVLKIVTARPKDLFEEYTEKWIEKNYSWMFEEILYINNITLNDNKTKWDICIEHWINYMVEDNPDYALELAESWVITYLLEKPWNKHRAETHENLIKVRSWDEVNL